MVSTLCILKKIIENIGILVLLNTGPKRGFYDSDSV